MNINNKPKEVNILGVTYKIQYVDNPSEVDIFKRSSLWGQIDYWTRTIRVYDNGRSTEDIWQTIWHEVLHGIQHALKLENLNADKYHDEIDVLALAITDILTRNKWVEIKDKSSDKKNV